jgi:hypothetical protein
MARETITRLIDDIDGGTAHETVTFGLDGNLYKIDLSNRNAKKLRSELAPFVERGSRVAARVGGRGGAGRAPAVMDRQRNRAIREWAVSNGYEVATRGRIRQEIIDEYQRVADR